MMIEKKINGLTHTLENKQEHIHALDLGKMGTSLTVWAWVQEFSVEGKNRLLKGIL